MLRVYKSAYIPIYFEDGTHQPKKKKKRKRTYGDHENSEQQQKVEQMKLLQDDLKEVLLSVWKKELELILVTFAL